MKNPGITVIIVSKGLDTMLEFCIRNVNQALAVAVEMSQSHIVLVDNASPFPYDFTCDDGKIRTIRFDSPASFAKACNRAASSCSNDLYLFLNNDVLLAERAILSMARVLSESPRVGICGSRLLFPDHSIQHCGVLFGKGDRGPYHCYRTCPAHLVPRATGEFQAVTGACMLVKNQVWQEAEGFDESYPFGLEDIDFCLRARQRGWKVFCSNETDSLHFESMTQGRVELDVLSRKLFMEGWRGKYCIDG